MKDTPYDRLAEYFTRRVSFDEATHTYKAEKQDNGKYTILDLEVFSATDRVNPHTGKTDKFDDEWITAAVQRMREREKGGYRAPAHVGHRKKDDNDKPVAGFLSNPRVRKAKVDGKITTTIVADVRDIPEPVFYRVRDNELPYRSVEINNPDKEDVSSMAWLQSEVPYFKYPLTTVALSSDSATLYAEDSHGMVAIIQQGALRPGAIKMSEEERQDAPAPKVDFADFPPKEEEGGGYPEGGGGEMEGGGEEEGGGEQMPPQEEGMGDGGGGMDEMANMAQQAKDAEPSLSDILKGIQMLVQGQQLIQQLSTTAGPAQTPMSPPPAATQPAPVPSPIAASEEQFAMSAKPVNFSDPAAIAQAFAERDSQIADLSTKYAEAQRNSAVRQREAFIDNKIADLKQERVSGNDNRVYAYQFDEDAVRRQAFNARDPEKFMEDLLSAGWMHPVPVTSGAAGQDYTDAGEGGAITFADQGTAQRFAESTPEVQQFAAMADAEYDSMPAGARTTWTREAWVNGQLRMRGVEVPKLETKTETK